MSEKKKQGSELTSAQLEQRRAASTTHGARSDAQIRPTARAQKRRLLRRIGLKASELDGVALGYVETFARAAGKVELLDRYIAEHGLVDEAGQVPGFMALYVSLLNSCRLSLAKLEDHLRARGDDVGDLASQLAALDGKAVRR